MRIIDIMRVLQVIDSLAMGGAEVLLKDMTPLFRIRQIECDVVALRQTSSSLEYSLHAAGVSLYFTGVDGLYSPRHIFPLAKLMQRYDIVHAHLFPAQLWAAFATFRLKPRVPLVITEHSPWNRRRRPWMRPLDTWAYSRYERIACISEITEEDLVRWCPCVAARTTLVPNGIPLEVFERSQAIELPMVPRDVPRLVFVGRFEPQKDQSTILRALVRVPDAHLLLVGDGPLRAEMEAVARLLGIAERVTFLGWRSDIPGILKASDIYIHSTNFDGFGIAACEAMAAGLPVLASNVPGLAQLVEGAGLLFPVGDDEVLAQQIAALIASPARRRQMCEDGRLRAKEFSIERTVDGYIDMYRSVLRTWPERVTREK
jgi:glycosyltransferase involved in cell wall biosynthesis